MAPVITITSIDLQRMLEAAAKQGVAEYIKRTQPAVDCVSQREAYRMFGEGTVRRWVKECKVMPKTIPGMARNSKRQYSIAELNALYQAERLGGIQSEW